MTDEPEDEQVSYADKWADRINEAYTNYEDDLDDATKADLKRICTKAANCLRGGVPTTFTPEELDVVRHLMPAHEVHQSMARRWVYAKFGEID